MGRAYARRSGDDEGEDMTKFAAAVSEAAGGETLLGDFLLFNFRFGRRGKLSELNS